MIGPQEMTGVAVLVDNIKSPWRLLCKMPAPLGSGSCTGSERHGPASDTSRAPPALHPLVHLAVGQHCCRQPGARPYRCAEFRGLHGPSSAVVGMMPHCRGKNESGRPFLALMFDRSPRPPVGSATTIWRSYQGMLEFSATESIPEPRASTSGPEDERALYYAATRTG